MKKTNINSHQEIINRFINYGENNFQAKNKQSTTNINKIEYKKSGVFRLVNRYRNSGHLVAKINPLNKARDKNKDIFNIENFNLDNDDLDKYLGMGRFRGNKCSTLRELIESLKKTYCDSLGAEYMNLANIEERRWIQKNIEAQMPKYNAKHKKWLLQRLIAAESFEKFLHRKYVGQKRFSLEGCDSLIPLLNILIEKSGRYSIKRICLGMAHRGRLNMLINILGKKAEDLFKEFNEDFDFIKEQTGDVKYHQGFSSDIKTANKSIHLTLMFNPSHLELINPVLEGYTRYHQDIVDDNEGKKILPVLIHGDASFSGQGVVMETLNMSQSRGYSTKGTVHIIINNQIGFTTSKQQDARSSNYCTDIVKMVNAPIFHVNADDIEMVNFVTEMALDYRMRFKKDVLIDLVCYRRHGHNEADEPAVTQPIMYKNIRSMETAPTKYAKKLINSGILDEKEFKQIQQDYMNNLKKGKRVAHNIVIKKSEKERSWNEYKKNKWNTDYESKVELETIQQLSSKLQKLPTGFKLHLITQKVMQDRKKMADLKINADWGFAENMAYATLVNDGVAIRLSGQDSGRGTFFHRHAVMYNQSNGKEYIPLQNLHVKQAKVQIINSILSEEAALGFEYGYATASPKNLVVWEAQFGDFVNGAQAIIDQFISSGASKWGRLSGLVLLLPHGLEGQGPEHSSSRVERFLQLCANHNMQICIPTTASQIFHLLRRQILRNFRMPLIVMTPKSLLRNKLATSPMHHFTNGKFKEVYGEQSTQIDSKNVNRIIICSGKIFYELLTFRENNKINNVAILRLEQLYPFPHTEVNQEINKYSKAKELVWCQEEPINQGAWYTSRHNFIQLINSNQTLHLVSRDLYAAPAEGSMKMHKVNQQIIIKKALTAKFTNLKNKTK